MYTINLKLMIAPSIKLAKQVDHFKHNTHNIYLIQITHINIEANLKILHTLPRGQKLNTTEN